MLYRRRIGLDGKRDMSMDRLLLWVEAATGASVAMPGSELLVLAIALLMAGAAVGLLAGLFGIGGGTLIVPILYETFGWFGIADEVRMPLCVGTSLAIIIPTSISSFSAHRNQGSVDMAILRAWIWPVVTGVLIGSALARFAPVAVFKLAFILISFITAARLLFRDKLPRLGSDLPTGGPMLGYGFTIGATSSLIGIGGGLVANMVMTLHGRAIHQSVATSAGIGVLVSLPGALGYVVAGWGSVGLPPLSLGFVSLIGLMLLMPTSFATARLGACLAHRISKRQLELAFAAYLVVVSVRFSGTLLGLS
jgi:uncharacterized membrane protein YfcA